jgi:hypothetical protein
MRERQKWENFIVNYASQAAAGSVNQRYLPVLIIVFNTATLSDGIWDTTEATNKAEISDQLKTFFREVYVVCIYSYEGKGR